MDDAQSTPDVPGESFPQFAARAQSELLSGGPPVDDVRLLDFIDGHLSPEAREEVGELVDKFSAWNLEYWRLQKVIGLTIEEITGEGNVGASHTASPTAPIVKVERQVPPRHSRTLALLVSIVATVLIAVGLMFGIPRKSTNDIAVSASPQLLATRSNSDAIMLRHGIYEIPEPYFQMQVRSDRSGYLTIITETEGTIAPTVLPKNDESPLLITAGELTDSPRLLCARKLSTLWAIVTDRPATQLIREWSQSTRKINDPAERQRLLSALFTAHKVRRFGVSRIDFVRK